MSTGLTPDFGSFLTPENEQFVQQQVDLGIYTAREEVINAGLDSLRQKQEQDLIERLTRADRDLKEGRYTEYDEEGLRKRFDDLKATIRQATASASGRK